MIGLVCYGPCGMIRIDLRKEIVYARDIRNERKRHLINKEPCEKRWMLTHF